MLSIAWWLMRTSWLLQYWADNDHNYIYSTYHYIDDGIENSLVWYDIIWDDVIWNDMIWYDLRRYDMIWFNDDSNNIHDNNSADENYFDRY